MKNAQLRMTGILAAILLIGTAAFALAEMAQSPRASQIPTIVAAGASSATPGATIRQSLINPTAGLSATDKTAAEAQSSTQHQDARPTQAARSSANADREVVKRSVRDDDEDGGHDTSDATDDDNEHAGNVVTTSSAGKSDDNAASSKTTSKKRASSKRSKRVSHSK